MPQYKPELLSLRAEYHDLCYKSSILAQQQHELDCETERVLEEMYPFLDELGLTNELYRQDTDKALTLHDKIHDELDEILTERGIIEEVD